MKAKLAYGEFSTKKVALTSLSIPQGESISSIDRGQSRVSSESANLPLSNFRFILRIAFLWVWVVVDHIAHAFSNSKPKPDIY